MIPFVFSFENIFRQYLLCRKNKRNTANALRFEARHEKNLLTLKQALENRTYRRYLFDEDILDKLTATLSSYLGHFKMANTYSLCCALWERFPFLKQYYEFHPENRKLVRKYKTPKGFRKVRHQYLYYRWQFPGDVLLFQVGRFYEFYHKGDNSTAQILSLAEMKKNKRRARYGFPVTRLSKYFRLLLHDKRSVTVIPEREQYWTRIKERLPRYRFECM